MPQIPSVDQAMKYLNEASRFNPGAWIEHSKNVALAAKLIADKTTELSAEKAYIFGLLHDIGRRNGAMQARHAIEGYRFMLSQGFEACARICMTHTFQYKDINAIYDSWDCSEQDFEFAENYIRNIQFDEYDLLIQLCDALSLDTGFCLLEKKMVSLVLRFGNKDTTIQKWKSTFEIKTYFDRLTGCSIYELLPDIMNNTFI